MAQGAQGEKYSSSDQNKAMHRQDWGALDQQKPKTTGQIKDEGHCIVDIDDIKLTCYAGLLKVRGANRS